MRFAILRIRTLCYNYDKDIFQIFISFIFAITTRMQAVYVLLQLQIAYIVVVSEFHIIDILIFDVVKRKLGKNLKFEDGKRLVEQIK